MSSVADAAIVAKAWDVITRSVETVDFEDSSLVSEEVKYSVDILSDHDLGHIVAEWFLEIIKTDLQENIVPSFWNYFDPKSSTVDEGLGRHPLERAVNQLYNDLLKYSSRLKWVNAIQHQVVARSDKKTEPVIDLMKLHVRATLLSQLPLNFETTVHGFYSKAFNAFTNCEAKERESESSGEHSSLQCPGCDCDATTCFCKEILQSFHCVNQRLFELGLLEQLAGAAVTSIIHERIEHFVANTCKGNFESSNIKFLVKWLNTVVVGWLSKVYCGNKDSARYGDPQTLETIEKFKDRLHHFLYTTCALARMDELFKIIIEFPESQPALEDLRDCLDRTDLRSKLIQTLKASLETRLLHPGVSTADILSAYVSAIKALRVLDPTGVILDLVCEPVRKYLRTRDNTVRSIVSSLTDDGSSELAEELIKGEPLVLDECSCSDEEMENWENWQPDPVDADPGKPSKTRRSSDIISMLVNIYGSKELFVNEYRSLLADRLLSQFNYDMEREIRYLELLKLRFGEAQLHYCEVMLKDIADSRRINAHIHSEDTGIFTNQEFPVNTMVLSAQFWPSFREEKLELPPRIKSVLDAYTRAFETLKGNRTLCWKPHLGLVSLEIELKDRTLNLEVNPVHATILMHFEEKSQWTIEELSAVMHVPTSALRRKISFWQSHGVIKEGPTDTFFLVEEQSQQKGRNNDSSDLIMVDEDEESESALASSHDQREEELQVFWSYIVGMLTNLESLPLERIHSTLRMFALQGPAAVECNLHELRQFLDRKVREQKLLFSGGLYKLVKQT